MHHHGLIPHHTIIAVVVALLSSLSFAAATVAQQHAAAQIKSMPEERPGLFLNEMLTSRSWWYGTLGNLGGYVLQAVALAYGSLLIVQPILVTAVLFALPLDARMKKVKLPRGVFGWGVVLVICLGVFVLLANPSRGLTHASLESWLMLCATLGPLMFALTVFGLRYKGVTRAVLLSVVTGVLAGITAVLTKVVVEQFDEGVGVAFGSAEIYAVVVVGLAGVYLQQVAFQTGSLRASMPTIHVIEPIAAAVLGVVLLQEYLRVTRMEALVLAVATVLMTFATIFLARDQADVELA